MSIEDGREAPAWRWWALAIAIMALRAIGASAAFAPHESAQAAQAPASEIGQPSATD